MPCTSAPNLAPPGLPVHTKLPYRNAPVHSLPASPLRTFPCPAAPQLTVPRLPRLHRDVPLSATPRLSRPAQPRLDSPCHASPVQTGLATSLRTTPLRSTPHRSKPCLPSAPCQGSPRLTVPSLPLHCCPHLFLPCRTMPASTLNGLFFNELVFAAKVAGPAGLFLLGILVDLVERRANSGPRFFANQIALPFAAQLWAVRLRQQDVAPVAAEWTWLVAAVLADVHAVVVTTLVEVPPTGPA